jgi:hypothetical protein
MLHGAAFAGLSVLFWYMFMSFHQPLSVAWRDSPSKKTFNSRYIALKIIQCLLSPSLLHAHLALAKDIPAFFYRK